MCYYRYVYYSRCQHAEFYKYTYCDKAKALGQPQRDAQCVLDDGALDAPGGSSNSCSQHHKNEMSTLTPSEAGRTRNLPEPSHRVGLPHADLVPRSVQHGAPLATSGYRNLNIDIPLDTHSSLSMELTHDGKVMELVARFEAYTDFEGSDVSQAHNGDRTRASSAATIRPFDVGTEKIRAAPVDVVAEGLETNSPPAEGETYSPRKSIPSQWKTTPRAPVLMTKMRGEEREKRKSTQGSSPSDARTIRGGTRSSVDLRKLRSSAESATFLTKDKNDTFESDITLPSAPSSPTKVQRTKSIKITVSPTRTSRLSRKEHARASSVVSTGDSIFHSARHSPVSQIADLMPSTACSPTSFVTADELHDEVSHYALSEADGIEQIADGTISPSRAAERKATTARPAAPKLSLRIPHITSSSTDRRPPFALGSASSSGSGTPASPSRSSRIPRIAPTGETTLKASSVKFATKGKAPTIGRNVELQRRAVLPEPQDISLPETPVAVPMRHVRTLNSTGTTPIISRESLEKSNPEPDKHAMVTSYLESVESNAHRDETPPPSASLLDTNPTAFSKGIADLLSKPTASDSSSRVTSQSTVKAVPLDDPVLKDTAVVSCRVKADAAGQAPGGKVSPARGRSSEYVPRDRKQAHSELSVRSSASSDLRATAPEFIPYQQEAISGVLAPIEPMSNALPFDPFGIDMYGMPWFYHMYPVPMMRPFARSPKKGKPIPRSRKRGDFSPKKTVQPDFAASDPGQAEKEDAPFTAQLEEIARHAAVRHEKEPQMTPGSPFQTTPTRNRPVRNAGSGLYDTIGRGRGRGRHAGVPIDATTPFPTPVPPSGRREYVGYTIAEREQPICGAINIERAVEWGGGICNKCDPSH